MSKHLLSEARHIIVGVNPDCAECDSLYIEEGEDPGDLDGVHDYVCAICGGDGVYIAHAHVDSRLVHFEVCADCVDLIEYGRKRERHDY